MSIDQASLSLKKDTELIDKDDVKTQWRSIYKVIHNNFFENADCFTYNFLKLYKQNPNVLLFLFKNTKNIMEQISL